MNDSINIPHLSRADVKQLCKRQLCYTFFLTNAFDSVDNLLLIFCFHSVSYFALQR